MKNIKNSLSASFIRDQAKRLSEELANLQKKEKELKHFPDFGSSSDDAAQEVAEYTTETEIIKKVDQAIRDFKEALKAINNGTYGICKICGEHIMGGRLEIRPESTTCTAHNKK